MPDIKVEVPDTRIVVREPAIVVNRSMIPIQSVAEYAVSASFAATIFAQNAQNAVTASYVPGMVTDWTNIPNKPVGLVSSSQQVNTGSFSGSFIGTATAAITVLQTSFTGSFTGSGSELVFTTIHTNQNSDSFLIIGNKFNNYSNRQTTVFRNGDVVVSGSITVGDTGVLVLVPRNTPATVLTGALFYSSSGELYFGT